jgi:hypothetical protein
MSDDMNPTNRLSPNSPTQRMLVKPGNRSRTLGLTIGELCRLIEVAEEPDDER